jgi:ComF family protein
LAARGILSQKERPDQRPASRLASSGPKHYDGVPGPCGGKQSGAGGSIKTNDWGERFNGSIHRAGGLLQLLRSALFLPRCRICGLDLVLAEERIICSECRAKIRPAAENHCRTCGKFLPQGVATCGACLLEPPPYDRHLSYAAYEETLREVIILYKYGQIEPLKHLLAGLYFETVRRRLAEVFDAVVPVPADRRRRHGFQPVRAMGAVLARRLGIAFRPRALRKKKSTPPQVGLSQAQRKANLDGVFALAAGHGLAGRRVLLIDDVTTTGTTLRKCAAELSKGGAKVTALTLAQARF